MGIPVNDQTAPAASPLAQARANLSTPSISAAAETVPLLTANILDEHIAYLEQNPTEDSGAGDPRRGGAAAPAASDPRASAKHAAYTQRKDAKREARKRRQPQGAGVGDFLSNLPEVEADVQYRFNFVIVGAGSTAQRVAEQTCGSLAARKLPSDHEAASLSPSHAATGVQSFHCLTSFKVLPSGGDKVTKMGFQTVTLGNDMPTCTSRLEALNTVMVFVLTTDRPRGTQDSFRAQLQAISGTIKQLRATAQVKLRPARALLLCSTMEDAAGRPPDDAEVEDWTSILADFEHSQGHTWKFGPIPLQNGDRLHAAFTEMASVQIARSREDEAETEESHREDGAGIERMLLEKKLQACNKRHLARLTPTNFRSESSSQGSPQPPVFEAEDDGSEVCEEVLAMHASMYGTNRLKSALPTAASGGCS